MTSSPFVSAAIPAFCIKVGTPDVEICISFAKVSDIPIGWVIQPSRQPVINHDLEKLFTEMTLSYSEAKLNIELATNLSNTKEWYTSSETIQIFFSRQNFSNSF